MRSELFRIPIEWGGIPLLGVGVLLALWAIVAVGLLVTHARRHGTDADFWGYLTPLGLAGGVIWLLPRFCPEGLPIRGYGVMLLLAIATGFTMAVHRARERGIGGDTVLSLVFWLFVLGIAGARLFFVIEYWEVRFAGQPLGQTLVDVLRFTEGGLVVYGSLIGAAVAFVGFTCRHRLPMRMMADVLAPSLAAGLAIGRLGCLLNGCCYGGQCDKPWAVTFPEGSPPYMDQLVHGELHGIKLLDGGEDTPPLLQSADQTTESIASINGQRTPNFASAASAIGAARANGTGLHVETDRGKLVKTPPSTRERSLPVHPTQIYSAVNAALLAWLLWAYYPSRRWDGEVILLLLTIYPVSRFLLEIIRTDEKAIFGTGLSISQNVSLAILAGAVAAWIVLPRLAGPPSEGPLRTGGAPVA